MTGEELIKSQQEPQQPQEHSPPFWFGLSVAAVLLVMVIAAVVMHLSIPDKGVANDPNKLPGNPVFVHIN